MLLLDLHAVFSGGILRKRRFTDYAKVFDYVDQNKLWKILKEMGIPDHLTCLLRNLYAGVIITLPGETSRGFCTRLHLGSRRKILIFLFLLFCIWMKQLLKSPSILQFSPTLGLFTASVWIVYRTQYTIQNPV